MNVVCKMTECPHHSKTSPFCNKDYVMITITGYCGEVNVDLQRRQQIAEQARRAAQNAEMQPQAPQNQSEEAQTDSRDEINKKKDESDKENQNESE